MRRLASVLAPSARRTDRPDAQHQANDAAPHRLVHRKSSVFASLSRKQRSSPSPPRLVASDLANSSSSSSSGSTTLRTPDDDGLPRTPSKKGSWKSWLGGKTATLGDHTEGHNSSPWQSSKNIPSPPKSSSNETVDVSDADHDDLPYSLEQMATARANARIMIMNSLIHEPTAHPLLQPSDTISFPRSCHPSRRLRPRETLESELHKKSLLLRLDSLSPTESSIAYLASKSISPRPRTYPNSLDDVFPSTGSVSSHSSGLESWVSRPCFEDRLQLWTRSDSGEIVRSRIPGSHLGVAALEFSESLELLAGTLPESDEDVEGDQPDIMLNSALEFTLPPLTLNPDSPAPLMKELKLEPLSSPSDQLRSKDFPAKPSIAPQPNISLPTLPKALPPARQLEGSTSGSAATNDPAPKRGVRFADDDGKDDQIPLGYVLRIRKNKEQKARFLREERARRERAAQPLVENRRPAAPPQQNRVSRVRQLPARPLISPNEVSKPQQPIAVSHVSREEERLRREVERTEMEKLRRSRESTRKQAEERERNYAEELRATRARREASRAGRPLESVSPSARVPDRDQDPTYASLRRSSMSHKHTPELVFSPVSPAEGSPSSSVPATPGSQYSFSRPPSVYSAHTASSEDVKGRGDGPCAPRRMSVVSDPAKGMLLHPPYDPRASFNPYWTNVPPVCVIPPVPPMPVIPTVNGVPFYGVDMPLLPPTAPFMVNQFGSRSHSQTGLAGQYSPLHSSASLPRNYSSEGVTSSSRNSSSHSFGSHQRRSSDDDATRMANTLGDPRTGSYHGGKTSGFVRAAPSQSLSRRSSWLPPEQSLTKKTSSLRPVSGAYSTGPPVYGRRRTAAS